MLHVKLNVFERFLMRIHWTLFKWSDKCREMVTRKYNKDGQYNTCSWNANIFNGEIILSNQEES